MTLIALRRSQAYCVATMRLKVLGAMLCVALVLEPAAAARSLLQIPIPVLPLLQTAAPGEGCVLSSKFIDTCSVAQHSMRGVAAILAVFMQQHQCKLHAT